MKSQRISRRCYQQFTPLKYLCSNKSSFYRYTFILFCRDLLLNTK